jgi:1-acyl-sn-glycerol-3-phosphate acyltransferase
LVWGLVNGAQAVLVFVWTAFWVCIALLIRLLSRRSRVPLALARRVWAPSVLRAIGSRVQIVESAPLDYRRPHLFVANHQSFVDIPVLFAALPTELRFLAKRELRRIPIVSWYISAMGMVFIDRQDSEASRESVEDMAEVLKDGSSMVSFPEGTRSRTGEVQSFKTGSFVAAIKSGVPVVPVAIAGSAQALPPDRFTLRPASIQVKVGSPIPTHGMSLNDRRHLADQAHRQVRLLIGER